MLAISTYFHLSRDIDKNIEVFIPRIPESFLVSGGEDRTIKRVCVSNNLINCMNAINYVTDKDMYDTFTASYKPLKVYTFELDENDVIPPETVYTYGVHDALINMEFWTLREISPKSSYLIQPTYLVTGEVSPIHIVQLDFDVVDQDLNVIG